MTKYLLTFSLLFFLVLSAKTQEIFNPDYYTFDCTGVLIMPELNDVLYVYDGNDPHIETTEYIIQTETSQEWVKKKADKNCLSSNPEDCLVWCLVEVHAKSDTFDIVVDTSTTDDWYRFELNIRSNREKKEIPVVCKNELSEELISALRDRLYHLGYDVKPNKKYKKLKGKINREFKKFQKDFALPIGKWSKTTMQFLYNS